MEKKVVIVFSPHPDDETLGVGGTIAKKISEGYEVLVVLMTDGKYAFSSIFGINSNPTPEELKEIRKKEVQNALKILGVLEKNILFLDFQDGDLEHNEISAEEKVAIILARNPPTEVYFTYSKDVNPDHRATNRIIKKALKKSGYTTQNYQYSIKQPFSRIGPIINSFANSFRHNIVHFDISLFVELKEQALNKFESQTTIISSKQTRPILSTARIKMHLQNQEIFYKD